MSGSAENLSPRVRPFVKQRKGFSLFDLMIVVALLVILSYWARPTFESVLLKPHRLSAIEAMLQLASCQEDKFRQYGYYHSDACQPDQSFGSDRYTLNLRVVDEGAGYVITATPDLEGIQHWDTCGVLSLDSQQQRLATGGDEYSCWSRL